MKLTNGLRCVKVPNEIRFSGKAQMSDSGFNYLPDDIKLQLPVWADSLRVLPNEVVRSALFNVGNRNQPRRNLENEKIATLGDGCITYTGKELRQDDELVWLNILNAIRKHHLGECVEFLPYSFLREIGWPTNGGAAERLRNCLLRMSVTGLTVSSKRIGMAINVSLIRKFLWRDEYTGKLYKHWKVWLEPEIILLFELNYLTYLDWQIRKKLPTGIATRLYGYWSSHRKPFPEGILRLMIVCGTKMPVKHFKEQLKEALVVMEAVGFLSYWEISPNDVVKVQRN